MRKDDLKIKMMRAYCMLIAVKDYAEITVKDIYERAGVSKMTFYRYFGNITALEEEIREKLLSALESFVNILKEAQFNTDIHETLFNMERTLSAFYPLYSPLATIKDKPLFWEEIENKVQTEIKQTFMDLYALSNEEVDFLYAFLMGGGAACITEYADNQHTASSEHIAAVIYKLVFYGLSGLIAKEEKPGAARSPEKRRTE